MAIFPLRRSRTRPACATATLALFTALLVAGCHRGTRRTAAKHPLPPLVQASPDSSPRELVIDAQKKVVIGRPSSFFQVRRVATEVGPILDQAFEQPEIRSLVDADAAAAGLPRDRFKQFFLRKQEADILLESGGDPGAISSAGAAGIAQWLGGTARGSGRLKVNELLSNRLTAAIQSDLDDLQRLRSQPEDYTELWSAAGPPLPAETHAGALRGPAVAADRSSAPGSRSAAPSSAAVNTAAVVARPWTRDDLIVFRKQQVRSLIASRRAIDERFDPRLALFAQTRYLFWMWRKYPSLDWVFEAYHGGEKGVQRTLQSYMGSSWARAGSVAHAILGRDRSGRPVTSPLSFEQIFFTTTPRMHRATFAYLYGLHDEHRTYWFKILMAEKAIAWYRSSPDTLHNEWEALRPGYPIEDAWYPHAPEESYADADQVKAAARHSLLIPAPPIDGVVAGGLPFLPMQEQAALAVARPEALGALKLVVQTYRRESLHPAPLTLVALTQPLDLVAQLRARFPAPPPKSPREPGTIPPDRLPDMHAAGLAVDILKPRDPWESKVLQYALSYWEDRERLHFNSETWGSVQAWRITPNPACRSLLIKVLGLHPRAAA